jgi:cytidylate kinase
VASGKGFLITRHHIKKKGGEHMSLITISQGIGCGGEAIAKIVAERLNLELYDDQRLKDEAIKMGIRPDEVKSFDEKLPGFFERIWSHTPELYIDLMESVVYEVAKRGQGVIIGHGSHILLRDFGCAFHVHVFASEESRIQYMVSQQGLSAETAEKLIQKRDHEQRGFLKYAFHVDWNDPSLYDLTINCGKMGTETAANLIMETAKSQEMQECSLAAIDSMDKLMLTKKIEAEILKNNFIMSFLHVEVPEKGVAQIRGFTSTEDEKQNLKGVVEGVSGISTLEYDVSVMPTGA